MNITQHFRKYFFLFLLILTGFGAFFVDLSVSVPASRWDIDTPQYTSIQIEIGGIANAQAKKNTELKDAEQENQQTINRVIAGLNWAAGIVTALVSPAIGLLGWLLSPDWTSGDLFGLRQYLYKLWITVSNIIYFIYAIALIIVAVMTMFNSKNYGARQLLPRLVVGILMVPFTWWIVQWAVSFSTVLTASVLSIPMETIWNVSDNTNGGKTWWNDPVIPTCIAFGNPDTKDKTDTSCAKEETKKMSPKDFSKKSWGIYGNIAIYAYGVFKIQNVNKVQIDKINPLKTAATIIHKGFIEIIMFLIFGILTIAMIFVLFMRVFKLWAYAIFSPIFTFWFVFKNLLWKADKDGTFTVQEFLGLVFLPAIVGLVLSFGLILINALNSADTAQSNGKPAGIEGCSKIALEKWESCKVAKIMGNPNNKIMRKLEKSKETWDMISVTEFHWWGLKVKSYGAATNADAVAKEVENQQWLLSAVGGTFGVIVLDFIAIAFIWIAFMAAKGVSKTAGAIMNPIENAGKQLANTMKTAPLYAKIPGIGSIKGLETATATIQRNVSHAGMDSYHNSQLAKMVWDDKNNNVSKEEIKSMRQTVDTIKDTKPAELAQNIYNNIAPVIQRWGGTTLVNSIMTRDPKLITEQFASLKSWLWKTPHALDNMYKPKTIKHLKELLAKDKLEWDDRILFYAYLAAYEWLPNKAGALRYLREKKLNALLSSTDDSDQKKN